MTAPVHIPGSGRILFVDDDPFYRDLAQDALEVAGYEVTSASDGGAALAELEHRTFDLMVLDLAMPIVTGIDVLERVRASRRHVDLPVLVITGHDDAESVGRAFDAGATSFLAKPLNWVLFVHHVQFVLKAARMQADLRYATRTAEVMSDMKTRLVGTLVTEFQGPLKSAFGFARLLKEEADGPIDSPLYKTWIGDLARALEKLSATHLKMLNFGRNLVETISINEERVALPLIVAGVVQNSREAGRRRQQSVSLKCEVPGDIEVKGDGMLLAQAFRNALENAMRFSRRSSEIAVRLFTDADGAIVIEIVDTAPTLSQTQVEEMVGARPFSAVRPEAVEASTGLKMARVLMEAHQGTFAMRSLGEGMLSELRIPRARLVGSSMEDGAVARLREVAAALQAAGGAGDSAPARVSATTSASRASAADR